MADAAGSQRLVDRVIDGFLGNPFARTAAEREDDEQALARLDARRAVERLARAGRIEHLKLLILAIGHARACSAAGAPDDIYEERTVPRACARLLPRALGDYLRIVAGAGRCHAVLRDMLGSSAAMDRVRREVWSACFGQSLRTALDLERVIRDHDVLLLGETGTGKEAAARAIQAATPGDSKGAPAPAAAINAAAVPETLVESELFGHVKGAFTGATEMRAGRVRSASGGCFFLDEAGDLPSTTQVKLLRVIETNEVYPLGSDASTTVDVRYVAATHKDLHAMVDDGRFRQDLYERLAGLIIRLPPLRERPDDIVEIGLAFVQRYLSAPRAGAGAGAGAGDDAQHRPAERAVIERAGNWLSSPAARRYPWPGNVRELQNALRSLLLGLEPKLAPETGDAAATDQPPPGIPRDITAARAPLADVEQWYIRRVLEHTDGNATRAARILEIDRSTIRRRLD